MLGYLGLGLNGLSLTDSIIRMENVDPSLNNPGALTWAPSSYCQQGKVGILVKFCTYDDGLAALNHQIGLNTGMGLNLNTFFGGNGTYAGYAPAAAGNDPNNYANLVAGWMGIDPTQNLSTLDSSVLYGGASADMGGSQTADLSNWFDVFGFPSPNNDAISIPVEGDTVVNPVMNAGVIGLVAVAAVMFFLNR